jgi:peptide/nickel transport system ATP-binding protein
MEAAPEGSHAPGPLLAPARPERPVLEVDNLCTEFHLRHANVRAVDGVSFEVAAGECVGLVGESGCGKSTIALSVMKLLPGIGHIVGGSVRLEGQDLVTLPEGAMRSVRGNKVAMIFQDPMTALNPTWSIGRQIAEAVQLHRDVSAKAARERALETLALVGVPRPFERLGQYPHQLSGGLRQRVMIAMALACEPKVLIADEPTTALDVTIQAQILDLIDELRARLKMAVVLITHDLGVIAERAERVMVMYAGKIVEEAPTEELFARMRHRYSEALLGSIPRLDQDRHAPLAAIPGLPPDLSRPIEGCRFAPRCAFAQDDCRAEDPPLRSDPSAEAQPARAHRFACLHPVSSGLTDHGAKARATFVTTSRPELDKEAEDGLGREPLLVLDDVVKEYPLASGLLQRSKAATVKALSGVSLSIRPRETFGLVGESGCGKTTLGRLVVALERPSRGVVRFDGEDLARLSARALRGRRRDLQLMFQDPYASLDPRMRIRSIVAEPLVVQGIGDRKSRQAKVSELLGEVGLPPRAGQLYPHELSGGQRQRVGLARALALNPRLIVADEPVSALDVSIQAQILNLIRSLQQRHGLTYLFISHDLAVVRYVADRIGVMYLGKLAEIGPSDEIYAHPAHPYTQGLVEAVPVPDPSRARSLHATAVRGELPSAIDPPSGCRYRTRCPLAQERCAHEEPVLRPFGPEHLAACHFPLQPPLSALEAGTPQADAQRR